MELSKEKGLRLSSRLYTKDNLGNKVSTCEDDDHHIH